MVGQNSTLENNITTSKQVTEITGNNFSFFNAPVTNTKAFGSISLTDVFSKITGPDYKGITDRLRDPANTETQQSEIKKNSLPFVTFSAEISGNRSARNAKTHSSYLCIDVDKITNVDEIKRSVLADNTLYPDLVFTSPRGNGLKIVYCIPQLTASPQQHKVYYAAVRRYFENKYKVVPDASPKNIASACFLCHDPLAYCISSGSTRTNWEDFLNNSKATDGKKKTSATQTRQYEGTGVYTNLLIKAAKKFLPTECHYSNVTSFIGKAISQGVPEGDTTNFLIQNPDLYKASETLYGNERKVTALISGLYVSYTESLGKDGYIYLTPSEFAYGIYKWELGRDGLKYVGIYRDGVVSLLVRAGFRKLTQSNKSYILIRVVDNIVEEVDHVLMKDHARRYIADLEGDISFQYGESTIVLTCEKLTEDFLTSAHVIFNHTFLSVLPEHKTPFLKDSTDTMYFPFSKTVAVIGRAGYIEILQYSDLPDLCVWKNRIINHDLIFSDDRQPRMNCHFAKFITNVSDKDESRVIAFRSAIGYMLHNFNRGSDGQAVILNDEAITNSESPEGGTGKGLFINALREMRDICKLDGKKFDGNERFCFQSVRTSTQIIAIDDLKPKTPFSRFFSVLTEGFEVERKNMEAQHIAPADSPKLLLSSNYIIESEGTSNRRRQFVLEFSDYYSSRIKTGTEKPIINEHGCTFFSDDWDPTEWNSFFSYMLESAGLYLQDGLVGYTNKNLGKNRMKQTCGDDFYEWATDRIERGELKPGIGYQVKTLFVAFKEAYYGEDDTFKQNKFSGLLKKMGVSLDWNVKTSVSNNVSSIIFSENKTK